MDVYEILNSPFDIDTHKANFVNYFEVVILPDGTIEYAVPSHQRKLESLVKSECPKSRYADYLEWLMEETGAVCVWSTFYMGEPNAIQKRRLVELTSAGLMVRRRL